MRPFVLLLSASLAAVPLTACGDKDGGGGGGDGTTDGGDGGDGGDGADGGGAEEWRPSGTGLAWMADGAEPNSLFHLEIEYPAEPRDGEAYYGFLSDGEGNTLGLGEIAVTDTTSMVFEADVGTNALVAGYDRFEAYMGTGGDAATNGTLVWSGQIDPTLKEAYEELLIADPETPDGLGSARHLQATIEAMLAWSEDTRDTSTDVDAINTRGETVANTIRGLDEDLDGDGNVSRNLDYLGVLGDDGSAQMILDDLSDASLSVEPGHPVKDLANYAYDCTQRVESFAQEAARQSAISSVCAATANCQEAVADAIVHLEWALQGADENGDEIVDPIDEGAIGCAITFANQMAYMEVGLAAAETE